MVFEGLSNNSKTITQPLDGAHNRPISVEKFSFQAPSYGSSMEDDEEVNSSLHPFDNVLEMDINFMKKGRWLNIVTKVRIVATGTQGQLMIRPPLLKQPKMLWILVKGLVFLSSKMRIRQLEGSQEARERK